LHNLRRLEGMQDLSDFLCGIQLDRDIYKQLPTQIKSLYSKQSKVQLAAIESLIKFVDGSQKVTVG